jgi:hypothetical protein
MAPLASYPVCKPTDQVDGTPTPARELTCAPDQFPGGRADVGASPDMEYRSDTATHTETGQFGPILARPCHHTAGRIKAAQATFIDI